MNEQPEILFEVENGIGLVTLNRPQAMNALTRNMCLALTDKLQVWAVDDGVRAVVLQGAGDRALCAGGDIRALYDSGKAGDDYARGFYHDEYRTDALVYHFPKPYIALLDGVVMGGGVGVSLHGSHRVVTERTTFAMPETGIGLFPDVGGTYFLPRCPGQVGLYLGLSGYRMKAADCIYAGVGDEFVSSDRLADLIAALGNADLSGDANAAVSEVISQFSSDHGEAALNGLRGDIDHHFVGDTLDAVMNSLAADTGDWAAKTLGELESKSPTSLKVTFRQIQTGATLDFDAAMRLEFRLACRFIDKPDFYEGVRAVILDKDQAPVWDPPTLDGISDADVDAFFASLGDDELVLLEY